VSSTLWFSTVIDFALETFNEGLVEALCELDLIEKDHRSLSTLMWPWLRPSFERRLREKRTKQLPRLHTFRIITERLVANTKNNLTYDVLATQLLQLSAGDGGRLRQLFLRSLPVEVYDFPRFLLVAAAFVNDLSLVSEYADVYFRQAFETPFGTPFQAAFERRQ